MDNFFDFQEKQPVLMSQKEFVEKTKLLLEQLAKAYHQGWQSRALKDDQFPDESVCEKCTGCGVFMKDGEQRDCFQDKEFGECYYRFCDYEQVGMDIEAHMGEAYELLAVDEVIKEPC